ncbi:MAG: hypothetical protein ACE5JI_13715 [Acidobacteriota bacterium]
MAEERAKNFIERLPEIIERREEDISHLDSRMVEILYPERAQRDFTITVVFGPSDDPSYPRAVALAERAVHYRREGSDRWLRHYATYTIDRVEDLRRLFSWVGDYPSCEILVKDKKVPYARELWLPFFWFFVKEEQRA